MSFGRPGSSEKNANAKFDLLRRVICLAVLTPKRQLRSANQPRNEVLFLIGGSGRVQASTRRSPARLDRCEQ